MQELYIDANTLVFITKADSKIGGQGIFLDYFLSNDVFNTNITSVVIGEVRDQLNFEDSNTFNSWVNRNQFFNFDTYFSSEFGKNKGEISIVDAISFNNHSDPLVYTSDFARFPWKDENPEIIVKSTIQAINDLVFLGIISYAEYTVLLGALRGIVPLDEVIQFDEQEVAFIGALLPGITYEYGNAEIEIKLGGTIEVFESNGSNNTFNWTDKFTILGDGSLKSKNGDECFTSTTKVLLSTHLEKSISEILVGDRVKAFDDSGRLNEGRVSRIICNVTDEWIKLSNGTTVTPGHRYLQPDGSFEEIGKMLEAGGGECEVVLADGTLQKVTGERIIYSAETAHLYEESEKVVYENFGGLALEPKIVKGWKTYNFTVEKYHTYIADGVRVHNDSILSFVQPADQLVALSSDLDDAAIIRDGKLVILDGCDFGETTDTFLNLTYEFTPFVAGRLWQRGF